MRIRYLAEGFLNNYLGLYYCLLPDANLAGLRMGTLWTRILYWEVPGVA